MSYLVTGVGGFIGFHLSAELLKKGISVFGIDNLNSYYDKSLKEDRIKINRDFRRIKYLLCFL